MRQLDSKTKGVVAVIATAVVGGGISPFAKIALQVFPPTTFTFLRFIIVALLMLPFIFPLPKLSTKTWAKIFFISIFGTGNVFLFAYGVKFTLASIAQPMYAIVPAISLILTYYIFKDKITKRKLMGISLGFFGTGMLVLYPLLVKDATNLGSVKGNLIVLSAVLSFSIYSVFSKKIQNYISPQATTFIFALTTILVLLPSSISQFLADSSWTHQISTQHIVAVLFVGIFGGAIYYYLYQYAIKHAGPVIASLTLYIQPVATYAWAIILLGEKLTLGIILGAALSLIGARLITSSPKMKTKARHRQHGSIVSSEDK